MGEVGVSCAVALLLFYMWPPVCLSQLAFKQPDTNPDINAIPIFGFQADGYATDQASRCLPPAQTS
jgi:hypothetical protein